MYSSVTKYRVKELSFIIDEGLVEGLGIPTPGKMCVEAAISYVFGEKHSDHPQCVNPIVTSLSIYFNDADVWKNDLDRAEHLKPLAIAQLGSGNSSFRLPIFLKAMQERIRQDILDVLREIFSDVNEALDILKEEHFTERHIDSLNDIIAFDGDKLDPSIDKETLTCLVQNLYASQYHVDPTDITGIVETIESVQYRFDRYRDRGYIISLISFVTKTLVELKTPGSKWIECHD